MTNALKNIDSWIFDLDNTLYPADSDLFPQVSVRMTRWIMDRFQLSEAEAIEKRGAYYKKYGTTLRGLMLHDDVNPDDFLGYVHDIDLTSLGPNPRLGALIEKLPGRRLVYTNGSRTHASRILAKLGIDKHFVEIFDIIAADYVPKPDPRPYLTLTQRFGIDPARACMVEDLAVNLEPAKAMGMTTVWLEGSIGVDGARPRGPFVDYTITNLTDWLESVVGATG
ncbi:pyrimidine 5'-nucleotidase [Roseiterribacter gracilis]|uniref:Pyrimidine 5'-nucleotidase n=1 Tax=Roseiterribacter gracilis TaxID=2812848 RepID=A0A8S8X957_9PROT|nr:pyrimidine 5'-nucleotidase [Rhodospirillales bacterium TMPK1]